MLGCVFSLDYRRRRLLKKTPDGPLRSFLSVPFPASDADVRHIDYVALDIETTGLDVQNDEIISIGYVDLDGLRIDLSSATHRIVRPTRAIPESSAVIHRITDDQAGEGRHIAFVLAELLKALAGKVLIVHHASVELGFIDVACQRVFGGRFMGPTVDTEVIERRWLERRDRVFRPRQLRLGNLRQQHNLPPYRAHNALSDAVAAAELFIAQMARGGTDSPVPLGKLLIKL